MNYVENHIFGLKFSGGYINDQDLDKILHDHLFDVGLIKVRRAQKSTFLLQKVSQWSNSPDVNVGGYANTFLNPPKLRNDFQNHG